MRLIAILLISVLLFQCCKPTSNLPEIKQVYYRDLTPFYSKLITGKDTIVYKTEILVIYSDSSGIQLKDPRPISEINDILSDKLKQAKKYPTLTFNETGFFRLQKKEIDPSNFIIKFINPVEMTEHRIYKCYLDISSQKLDTRYFLVQDGDTSVLVRPGEDFNTVSSYQALLNSDDISGLEYPDPSFKTKRNILKQKLGGNPKLTYQQEIDKLVTVQHVAINNFAEIKKVFVNDNFVIGFVKQNVINDGDFTQEIIIYDDSLSLKLSLTGTNKIEYRKREKLNVQELTSFKQLYKNCNIRPLNGDSIPYPYGKYAAELIYVYVKSDGNFYIGGLLDPVNLSTRLTDKFSEDSIKKDCRKKSSTLGGNYELLLTELTKKFSALDSLNRRVYQY